MALKSVYGDTRGDAKKLARDVRPGDVLYVVHDIATNLAPYEDGQLYSTYVVAKNTAPITGNPMVASVPSDGHGTQTVQQLLSSHRKVYTQPPAGLRDMAHSRQVATNQQVAAYATRAHQADIAKDRRQPVTAGKKKSGWF